MYHPFTIAETLKTAWDVLKKNFSTIAVFTILAFSIVGFSVFVIYFVLSGNVLVGMGVFSLLIIISFIFLGFIKLLFQLMDKQYYEFEFADIVPHIKMLYSYLLLLIIVSSLSVFLSAGIKKLDEGITQNIIGIIVGGFFQFFFLFYFPMCACFIVDDNSGPFESVRQSFYLIKGNFLKYILLFLVIEVMVFFGSAIIIGMIFVIPFVNLILVVAYRKLIYSHQDVDDTLAETN